MKPSDLITATVVKNRIYLKSKTDMMHFLGCSTTCSATPRSGVQDLVIEIPDGIREGIIALNMDHDQILHGKKVNRNSYFFALYFSNLVNDSQESDSDERNFLIDLSGTWQQNKKYLLQVESDRIKLTVGDDVFVTKQPFGYDSEPANLRFVNDANLLCRVAMEQAELSELQAIAERSKLQNAHDEVENLKKQVESQDKKIVELREFIEEIAAKLSTSHKENDTLRKNVKEAVRRIKKIGFFNRKEAIADILISATLYEAD